MTFQLHAFAPPAGGLRPTFDTTEGDALYNVDAPEGLEVRVWNEHEFRCQGRLLGAGVHVVVSDAHACARDTAAQVVQALRAQFGAATTHILAPVADDTAPRRSTARGGLPPGALRRVCECIARRLAEKIELQQLADIAGLSVCHFSRAFKQSTGLPPHRYLMRERVQAAAALIRATDRPLVDISLDVGFSDQSHFTRCFSEVVGETPRGYRRQHR